MIEFCDNLQTLGLNLDRREMTSPGDDKSSGTMKLFPDLGLCICESMNKISLLTLFWYQEFTRFARLDWMGLLGGDQSGRIKSSHSIIRVFARSEWMGL